MLQEQLELLRQSAEQGDSVSREQLFTVLYDKLHTLAQGELHRGALVSLSPTTLLQETHLDLSSRKALRRYLKEPSGKRRSSEDPEQCRCALPASP
ncbi:MAG TPA: ECF-type sigma factor [Steroidobacteraceae bacterium]|jgi:hypothetical protein|nr:ECF-type sigma factor [Steroidobacteraceae bacterium]